MTIRYFVRLTAAFFERFKFLILIGTVGGLFLAIILNSVLPKYFVRSVTRIGITGRYKPEDLPVKILSLVSDGLTRMDDHDQVVPALAKSWEAKEKGKVWVFHLKEGLKWQDGKPLLANTVNYHFEEVSLKVINKYTLEFDLNSPFAAFPSILAKPTFRKGLLGTGPWKVTNLSVISGVVSKLVLKDAKGNQQIYKFYPTEDSTKLAFKLGEIDKINEVLDPIPFDKWQNTVNITSLSNPNLFMAVFFNTEDSLLSDKSVRQALSYAIDKNLFAGTRALGPISPNSWAFNPLVKSYDYDPKRARELISSLSKEIKNDLKIKLVTSPILLDEAETVKKNWEAIGFKVTVQVTSARPDNYQAYLAIFDVPADPDQYAIWHSTQKTTNISHYKKNTRIDKLLEDGRLELDKEARKQIYFDFQRFLLEDAPVAFLVHPLTFNIERK